MIRSTIISFEPDFRRVAFAKILRTYANLSLNESIDIVTRLVNGESISLSIATDELAEAMCEEAMGVGVICKIDKQ